MISSLIHNQSETLSDSVWILDQSGIFPPSRRSKTWKVEKLRSGEMLLSCILKPNPSFSISGSYFLQSELINYFVLNEVESFCSSVSLCLVPTSLLVVMGQRQIRFWKCKRNKNVKTFSLKAHFDSLECYLCIFNGFLQE